MRNLRHAVGHLNEMHAADPLDGVFISGDLTSSTQLVQFRVMQTLIDPLVMPYFPVLGDHDS